jgi:hypothetical protein
MKLMQKFSLLLAAVSCSSVAAHKDLYEQIGREHNIPKEVLYSLALTETGIVTSDGAYRPWALTLNWKGKDYRFNDKNEACTAVKTIVQHNSLLDIGETQLNWRYQKEGFKSPCDFLDREIALNKTAQVLNACYTKHRNWVRAAGCYHRPKGGELAEIYMDKFAVKLTNVINETW